MRRNIKLLCTLEGGKTALVCPYALPAKGGLVHCTAADMPVNPSEYPCFGNYEECPIYRAEEVGDCRSCPLYGSCPKAME